MWTRATLRRRREGLLPKGGSWDTYPVRVNLGCGFDYRPGWVNVDRYAPKVDRRLDLFKAPWPFKDGSVDYVLTEQVLEHVPPRIGDEDGLLVVLAEIHRILRPGGLLYAGVPYAGSANDYENVTHYRRFVPHSFDFADPSRRTDHPLVSQSPVRFRVLKADVLRAITLGRWMDTSYHFPKHLGVDPNVGRRRALQFLLQRL